MSSNTQRDSNKGNAYAILSTIPRYLRHTRPRIPPSLPITSTICPLPAQGNMPGEYDSTSSGGYGTSANVWSARGQRGFDNTNPASANAMGAYTSTDPAVSEVGRSGVQKSEELPSRVDDNGDANDFGNGQWRTGGFNIRPAQGGGGEGVKSEERGAEGNRTGLIDQSLSGGDLKQDAGWGWHEREAEPGEMD